MSGASVVSTAEVAPGDVIAASHRLRGRLVRTPVLHSPHLDAMVGARCLFKCENFQHVGAFKARGALHAICRLDPAVGARGIVAHSSGNHGAAVAWAAAQYGWTSTLIMPTTTPRSKVANVERYGGQVIPCEPTFAARESVCADWMARTGAVLVHPFEDPDVIAGQGTAALELFEDAGELDWLLVPVGGGGLLAGSALAARAAGGGVRTAGVEPEGADDAARSFRSGVREPMVDPRTVADGLRGRVGVNPFSVIRREVEAIETVSEAAIVAAMRRIWEELKIIIEPSCAVPFAGLLERRFPGALGRRVGLILTGGNVDLDRLPWQ